MDNSRKKAASNKLVECRCSNCNALLGRANIVNGTLELKCKCGTLTTISIQPESRASYQERLNLSTK